MELNLPKDAEGREIPLDTECLYICNGEKQDVLSFTYYREEDKWEIETDTYIANSIYLYITPPDSWEKLEDDLDRCIEVNSLCGYYSPSGDCCDCALLNTDDACGCGPTFKSIKDRIRKLRGENDG